MLYQHGFKQILGLLFPEALFAFLPHDIVYASVLVRAATSSLQLQHLQHLQVIGDYLVTTDTVVAGY